MFIKTSSIFVGLAACMAAAALIEPVAAGWLGSCIRPKKILTDKVDLDGLNKYLVQVPGLEPAEDLAHLEEHVDQLVSGGVRRAARLLLDLAHAGDQCNEQVLSMLEDANAADLKSSGAKRTDKLIGIHLTRVLKACTSHIEETLAISLNQTPEGNPQGEPSRFSQAFIGAYDRWAGRIKGDRISRYKLLMDSKQRLVNAADVASLLRDLMGEPKLEELQASAHYKTEKKQKLELAFDTYLVGPCQRFISQVDHLLGGSIAVANIQFDEYLFYKQTATFRHSAWTARVCRAAVEMGRSDRTAILKQVA